MRRAQTRQCLLQGEGSDEDIDKLDDDAWHKAQNNRDNRGRMVVKPFLLTSLAWSSWEESQKREYIKAVTGKTGVLQTSTAFLLPC